MDGAGTCVHKLTNLSGAVSCAEMIVIHTVTSAEVVFARQHLIHRCDTYGLLMKHSVWKSNRLEEHVTCTVQLCILVQYMKIQICDWKYFL